MLRPQWDRWLPDRWPEPPAWRRFLDFAEGKGTQVNRESLEKNEEKYWADCEQMKNTYAWNGFQRQQRRGHVFRLPRNTDRKHTSEAKTVQLAVNAAIHLRRPLLVTGAPGTGKSSLAHAIAVELGLGPVLTWAVTPRSQLQEGGLYLFDAVGRLQDTDVIGPDGKRKPSPPSSNYTSLGPVGTAFLPFRLPRVLLIDELDKGDLQLPHELLHLFEEGTFEIPQLVRDAHADPNEPQRVRTADPGGSWPITAGRVQCREFPIIVLTSNGERDFPPAFHRRCIRVEMPLPAAADLLHLVEAHFGGVVASRKLDLEQEINAFLEGEGQLDRATDQLLNAWQLLRHSRNGPTDDKERRMLRDVLYKQLNA